MASGASPGGAVPSTEAIPFYRNIRVIRVLAQIVFVIVILIGVIVLFRNVAIALRTANLPADFSFLDDRAGLPIAETPIRYQTADPYWKALLIGFLNTLKVALIGVMLTSLLGVVIGVMRLSRNWLVRQIAAVYVETVRNTPLAVQIVFWYLAVFLPRPPRIQNAIELPGGVLFSNVGVAFPWLYPSYRFSAWLPWLIAAAVVLVILLRVRQRQIERSERPGNPWLVPLLAAVVIVAVGYLVAGLERTLPEGIASDFNVDRGRGTIYLDADGNAEFDPEERFVPFARVHVTVAEGRLEATTQNLTESGRVVNSVFRFPPVRESEVESAEVLFADPEAAAGLLLHFQDFPSQGLVYRDVNENGVFDRGEELGGETGGGYSGIDLVLEVQEFERTLVADRNGQFRIPRFEVGDNRTEYAEGNDRRFGVFVPPQPAAADGGGLETSVELLEAGPLVLSRAYIPVSNYEGGFRFTINYLALLLALVVYTASFIAEIVRGGVLAVPKGQTEAAKALGLSGGQIFALVVFPQALRIILPPMISQYLNLTKNSSLGILAAYAELFVIASIVANQTGASIPIAIILIVSYLAISFAFALVLNIVNERLAIRER